MRIAERPVGCRHISTKKAGDREAPRLAIFASCAVVPRRLLSKLLDLVVSLEVGVGRRTVFGDVEAVDFFLFINSDTEGDFKD